MSETCMPKMGIEKKAIPQAPMRLPKQDQARISALFPAATCFCRNGKRAAQRSEGIPQERKAPKTQAKLNGNDSKASSAWKIQTGSVRTYRPPAKSMGKGPLEQS